MRPWLFIYAGLAWQGAFAQEIDTEKKSLIDQLCAVVEVADGGNLEEKVRTFLNGRLLGSLAGTNFAGDPLLEKIVTEAVDAVIKEEFNNGISESNYRIYSQYLSADEIRAFADFYSTPAGQKALKLLPEILAEAKAARHRFGRSLENQVELRVQKRFEKEHPQSGTM